MSLPPPGARPVAVVLAVKRLADAKSRLAAVFPSPAERADFVAAMLTDTLAAVRAAGLDRTVVVSPDPRVHLLAEAAGAHAVAEHGEPGADPLNGALRLGARYADGRWSPHRLLFLQADLPALRPDSLTEALAAAGPGAAFVADHDGSGTAALIAPPGFGPRFGPASAAAHRDAGARELDPGGRRWPDLRSDVDTPADLDRTIRLRMGHSSATRLTSENRSGMPHPIWR